MCTHFFCVKLLGYQVTHAPMFILASTSTCINTKMSFPTNKDIHVHAKLTVNTCMKNDTNTCYLYEY